MDVTDLLDGLNDAQREAVSAQERALLVLAGAGSGKTRVLVHRIAWLQRVAGVAPWSILAVTFTNKAAGEMRARIEQLLGGPAGTLWAGTFHGIAHRLLRMHWKEAGLPQGFQILDSEDQQRVIKRVLKALELDDSRFPPKQVAWFINSNKDEGRRPAALDKGDPAQRQMVRLYEEYERACERAGNVDFAELLLRTTELLGRNADLLEHYRRRFRHILVDEFQDTNAVQYAFVRLLAGQDSGIMVVGDDDQSIYGWRGARIENILRFPTDFPGARTVRLEQNYRSTNTILKAANAVIGHNSERLGKTLWTDRGEGEALKVYAAYNEHDEAQFVVERIRRFVDGGHARAECAILYRSNAQSRVFEEALLHARMPYRVYGGLRFYERQEVKDSLAYLKLLENRDEDASFDRVVNLPTRGIGQRTLDDVRGLARAQSISLWRAARALVDEKKLPARAATALAGFLTLVDEMETAVRGLPLSEQVDHAIQASGLADMYAREKGDRSEARLENLQELVNAARGFDSDDAVGAAAEGEEELSELALFLAHAALEAGEGQAEEWEDCVQLMTLHSVKGLEFPLVFMCGMEDGLFPHQRSVEDGRGLEEERRLCYVGMTRAREQLYLCYAEQRRLYGSDAYGVPSRFLREVPTELIEELRPRVQVTRPLYSHGSAPQGGAPVLRHASAGSGLYEPPAIRLGARVRHPVFGEGTVLNAEGQGAQARVQVNFERAGAKWLVLQFAKLEQV
jgi:DNA helicase-2/ATP-dependent DNA helicase PcrA